MQRAGSKERKGNSRVKPKKANQRRGWSQMIKKPGSSKKSVAILAQVCNMLSNTLFCLVTRVGSPGTFLPFILSVVLDVLCG